MTLEHGEAAAPNPSPTPPLPTSTVDTPSERELDCVDSTREMCYAISVAPRKDSKNWQKKELPFSDFRDKAEHPADHKECGGWLGGTLRGRRRTAAAVAARSVAALDYDRPPAGAWKRAEELGVLALLHTTYSSTEKELRFRVIVPLDRDVTPEEYPRVIAALAARIGTEGLDAGSYQSERFMYWPAVADEHRDAYRRAAVDGAIASVEDLLAEAPKVPEKVRAERAKIKRDPYTIDGPVGAFNRAYDLNAAIEAFGLPYRPSGPERWTYTDGSTEGGLHEVAPGLYVSHHATDPANDGHAHSAFDLVRRHGYGLLDEHVSDRARPVHRLPSHELLVEDLLDEDYPEGAPVREELARGSVEDFGVLDEGQEPTQDAPGAGWGAVPRSRVADLVLAHQEGRLQRLRPEIGFLGDVDQDGEPLALFYRGRTNGIAGDSNGGKTFTAIEASKQELVAGSSVVYVDFEDTIEGILMRLLDAGVDPAALSERFGYVQPEGKFDDPKARAKFGRVLDEYQPTLVVIDSAGEALSMEGSRPNEDDEVARWFKVLPRWVAAHPSRPAVVILDHVTKAEGGLWPIGSQRKRAAINGAQYRQDVVEPFSRTRDGYSKLTCAKDRHGNYYIGQVVAELGVTNSTGSLELAMRWVTPETEAGSSEWRPTEVMEAVSEYLAKHAETEAARTQNQVVANVVGKKQTLTKALALLQQDGFVEISDGPNRSLLYTLLRPYPDLFGQDEE